MEQHHQRQVVKTLCDIGALRGVVSEAVTSRKKDTPMNDSPRERPSKHVRIPINLSLLQSISQLCNSENPEPKDAEEIIRQANSIANRLPTNLREDLLRPHIFSQTTTPTSQEHASVNWAGVIIKLHEVLAQAKHYEHLLRDISKSTTRSSTPNSLDTPPNPFAGSNPPKSPEKVATKSRSDSLVIKKEVASPRTSSQTSLLRDALESPPPLPFNTSPSMPIPPQAPDIFVSYDYGHVETDPVILPDGSHFSQSRNITTTTLPNNATPTSAASSVGASSISGPSSYVKSSSLAARRPSVPFNGFAAVSSTGPLRWSGEDTPPTAFARYSTSPMPAEWNLPVVSIYITLLILV